jgi:hypothetical protein
MATKSRNGSRCDNFKLNLDLMGYGITYSGRGITQTSSDLKDDR